MSWLSQLLHPGRGYDRAKAASQQYYNTANQTLTPYTQGGVAANDKLNNYYDQLSHPEKLQDEWSRNYKESDAAKHLEQSAIDRGMNVAGANGLIGSSAALNNIQQEATDIRDRDQKQYMHDLMEKYLAGIGITTNQFNTGAGTASTQAQQAMNQGQTEAGLDFGKYNAGPNLLGQGASSIMQMLTQYLTGGMGGGQRPSSSPSNYGSGMYIPSQGGGY